MGILHSLADCCAAAKPRRNGCALAYWRATLANQT